MNNNKLSSSPHSTSTYRQLQGPSNAATTTAAAVAAVAVAAVETAEAAATAQIPRSTRISTRLQSSSRSSSSADTISFGYGLISGYIGAIAVYPIDLVKTKMQTQTASNAVYRNGLDCLYQLCRGSSGGFRSMWRGSITQLIGIGPEKAIKISTNAFVSSLLPDETRSRIVAGACAGAMQVLVTNPIEIIKIQFQLHHTQQQSLLQALRAVGGPMNLYRGAGACLLRDVPFSAIYFPTYAALKSLLQDEWRWSAKAAYFTSGLLAGIPAAFLVTPADVIKTRIQSVTAAAAPATAVSTSATASYFPAAALRSPLQQQQLLRHSNGVLQCAVQLVRSEGLSALFKGGVWRVLKSAPQFGITLFVYESLKDFCSSQ